MWGLRWSEWSRSGQLIFKQRDFASEAARLKFIERLTEKGNFNQIDAYSDPS